MQAKVGFHYKKKRLSFNARKCGMFGQFWGLMFSRREKAENLLFEFRKPVSFSIHSVFVFFPFVAVWLDEKGNVTKIKIIKPFTLSVKPKRKYKKLLEIPINRKNRKKLQSLSRNFPQY